MGGGRVTGIPRIERGLIGPTLVTRLYSVTCRPNRVRQTVRKRISFWRETHEKCIRNRDRRVDKVMLFLKWKREGMGSVSHT